ncbi:MAG: hypothetical protein J6R12_03180 [Bacteroidales bacterium]|nr:hypothetical protein [Bacteroidales bacterium]
MKDGYYGVINKKGETILPFEYHNVLYCGLYDDNYIIVHKYLKKGGWFMIIAIIAGIILYITNS